MQHEIKTQMKSIKQKNFQNQKQIFCYYCATSQESVHYCTEKKCHINSERINKVIIAAAERKGNYEIYGDWIKITLLKKVMEMDMSHLDDEKQWHKEMKKKKRR